MIAGVHLEFLAQSSLRVSVFVQWVWTWVWTYVTGQRGSQIILNSRPSEQAKTDADATILHR
jgi:NADH dehydrogenase